MFERFTRAAHDTVVRTQDEAREMGQSPIGTEHLLLALLADPSGPVAAALHGTVDAAYVRAETLRRTGAGPAASPTATADSDAEDAAALKAIGIDLDAVRRAIEENFGPGALRLPRAAPRRPGLLRRITGAGHIPFSDPAKKALELSLREAMRLKHRTITPEHIMLGILREGQGLGVQILVDAGVDLGGLRADLTRVLDERAA